MGVAADLAAEQFQFFGRGSSLGQLSSQWPSYLAMGMPIPMNSFSCREEIYRTHSLRSGRPRPRPPRPRPPRSAVSFMPLLIFY